MARGSYAILGYISIAVAVFIFLRVVVRDVSEGFRETAAQRLCETEFNTCKRELKDSTDGCTKKYNACMKAATCLKYKDECNAARRSTCDTEYDTCMAADFPAAPTGTGTTTSYGEQGGIYVRDASGNRVLLSARDSAGNINTPSFGISDDKQAMLDEYQRTMRNVWAGTDTTPSSSKIFTEISNQPTRVGYSQLGNLPTQEELDKAQGADFMQTGANTSGGRVVYIPTSKFPTLGATAAPLGEGGGSRHLPAGMTESVKEQVRRDTVEAVREELQKLFSEGEYLYKLEEH
jgi:hypothetical protein